jgi:hypothetical protein
MIHTFTTLNPGQRNGRLSQSRSSQSDKHNLQARLDLVLQQYQLGIDNAALVESDPQLQRLVEQIRDLTPTLCTPQRKLTLRVDLSAPLTVPDQEPEYIQATVNVGFRRSVPRLFDWSIRRPVLSWQDRVRLWVATEHYRSTGIVPGMMRLIVIALSQTSPPQPVVFHWNHRHHRQTTDWLVQRVLGQPAPELSSVAPTPLAPIELIDLSAIPEVPI